MGKEDWGKSGGVRKLGESLKERRGVSWYGGG